MSLISIVFILVGICFLSGCNNTSDTEKNKFVGTWKASNGNTSVLFSDSTCTIAGVSGIWDIKDKSGW